MNENINQSDITLDSAPESSNYTENQIQVLEGRDLLLAY